MRLSVFFLPMFGGAEGQQVGDGRRGRLVRAGSGQARLVGSASIFGNSFWEWGPYTGGEPPVVRGADGLLPSAGFLQNQSARWATALDRPTMQTANRVGGKSLSKTSSLFPTSVFDPVRNRQRSPVFLSSPLSLICGGSIRGRRLGGRCHRQVFRPRSSASESKY